MTLRKYTEINFREETLIVIRRANKIIEEYSGKGYALTLRQLYYQFVARGLLENHDRNYDRLGGIISDARLAGLVSWDAIQDRTRFNRDNQIYDNPSDAVTRTRANYHLDLWEGQPFRPFVGIEKDAMVGVISEVCHTLRVPFTSFRGYNSQSSQWRLGQQFARYVRAGQQPILFHLGDHDPDGIDMTRDNRERLSLFAGVPINIQRLALNMDQVQKFKPPPNPAKSSSARYESYRERFGEYSWELDALPTDTIAQLIEDAIRRIRDEKLWAKALTQEAEDKDTLDIIIKENLS